jgi:hypothetical protein
MTIESVKMTEAGAFEVVEDGITKYVPDDMTNTDRQRLEEWDGEIEPYVPPVPLVPVSASRRQFKMQLAIAGLSSEVSAWVSVQPELVQIAFNESGSFNRNDEMLVQGFAALGFTAEQVDVFFTAASQL